MTTFLTVVLVGIGLALVLGFIRLLRGPSLADRVVSLDLITSVSVALMAALAIITDTPMLLDVAVVLALIAFLGTVGFATLIVRVRREEEPTRLRGVPARRWWQLVTGRPASSQPSEGGAGSDADAPSSRGEAK